MTASKSVYRRRSQLLFHSQALSDFTQLFQFHGLQWGEGNLLQSIKVSLADFFFFSCSRPHLLKSASVAFRHGSNSPFPKCSFLHLKPDLRTLGLLFFRVKSLTSVSYYSSDNYQVLLNSSKCWSMLWKGEGWYL